MVGKINVAQKKSLTGQIHKTWDNVRCSKPMFICTNIIHQQVFCAKYLSVSCVIELMNLFTIDNGMIFIL